MITVLNEIGSNHKENGTENQDVICHGRNSKFSVISLADGVSSCREARSGAETAARAITNLFLKKGDYFLDFEEKEVAELSLSHICWELKKEADAGNEEVEAFSSTLASVLIDRRKKRMLCLNLGDGMILSSGGGRCRILAMPSDSRDGCCVTTTQGASSMVTVKLLDLGSEDESVMICSDGAWKLMCFQNRLKPEIYDMLAGHEYGELRRYLAAQKHFDDCSFISLDMRKRKRRASA